MPVAASIRPACWTTTKRSIYERRKAERCLSTCREKSGYRLRHSDAREPGTFDPRRIQRPRRMLRLVRVLFVAYSFPPVGGAGVQRVLKFVRHLPAHGITPIVLTASNPSVPIRDDSLLAEIGADIRIERVLTLEPSYSIKRALVRGNGDHDAGISTKAARFGSSILFPDPQLLWLPSAGFAIRRLAREGLPIDAVIISVPPFSQLLLVPWIRRFVRAPIVLDYRDEWETTLRAGHEQPAAALVTRAAKHIERAIVRRADAVTTATEEFRTALLERIDALEPEHVHFLPNGWDRDDLPIGKQPLPGDRFRVSYAGTVLRLTSLRSVVEALRIVHAKRSDLAACIDLVVLGRVTPSERAILQGTERLGVQLRGYVEHRRALIELARSHLNLCVLDDIEGAERIYPAKIFELMALRRRSLVIAPPGALERLAKQHRMGDVVSPGDPKGIAQILERHVEAWQAGVYDPTVQPVQVERYERRALAGELAGILRNLCDGSVRAAMPGPMREAALRAGAAG